MLSHDSDCREVLFIAAGRVRVLNFAASGREVAYATIEAGSQVGELAALDGEPRSASVEALDDCLIAALPSGPFHELLLAHGELAVTLLKNLARIIRRTDERIAELSVLGAMQRVYRELLRLAQAQPDGSAHRLAAADPGEPRRLGRHDTRDGGASAGAAHQDRGRAPARPRADDPQPRAARSIERARRLRQANP